MKRVTITDIAKSLGVHHSTVSRAMRNDRRIPVATREKVRAAMEELGYQPDPMLSALVAYRSEKRKQIYRATLAWVTNYPTRDGWKEFQNVDYFRGASRRAAELGYMIEHFWLHEPGMTQRRATQILTSRNVQGLLFIPQPRSLSHLRLDWEKFSAVRFGRTLSKPWLHNVDSDHFVSMSILMRQIKKLGYVRPGFVSFRRVHESNHRAWTAAYWAFQSRAPQEQIPVFIRPAPLDKQELQAWYLKYRPDVIVTHSDAIVSWLAEMGVRVPEDVGVVVGAKHGEIPAHYSGINENNEYVGETAVNFLVQMINRGETGIPQIPISTLVEGTWVAGETVRPVNRPRRTKRSTRRIVR